MASRSIFSTTTQRYCFALFSFLFFDFFFHHLFCFLGFANLWFDFNFLVFILFIFPGSQRIQHQNIDDLDLSRYSFCSVHIVALLHDSLRIPMNENRYCYFRAWDFYLICLIHSSSTVLHDFWWWNNRPENVTKRYLACVNDGWGTTFKKNKMLFRGGGGTRRSPSEDQVRYLS